MYIAYYIMLIINDIEGGPAVIQLIERILLFSGNSSEYLQNKIFDAM